MKIPGYITIPETTEKFIEKGSDYLIIDVRSSDFVGGNIPRAINIPSWDFRDPKSVTRLIAKEITPRLPELTLVIFHCMRSQSRGPWCAGLMLNDPTWPKRVEVKVMRGGYQSWLREHRGNIEYFENLPSEQGKEWLKASQVEELGVGDNEEEHSKLIELSKFDSTLSSS